MSWKKHAKEFEKLFKEIEIQDKVIDKLANLNEWHNTKEEKSKQIFDASRKNTLKILDTILHDAYHENLSENNFMYRAIFYHEIHEHNIDELNQELEEESTIVNKINTSKELLVEFLNTLKKEGIEKYKEIRQKIKEDQVLIYCKQLLEDDKAGFREFNTYFSLKYIKKFYKRTYQIEKELYRDNEKGIIITRQSTPVGKNKEYRYTYTKNGEERAYIFGYPSDKTSFYLQYLWNPENPKPPRVEQKRYDANEAWKNIKNQYFDEEGNIKSEFQKEEKKIRKKLEEANKKRKKYVQKTREKRAKHFEKITKEIKEKNPDITEDELKEAIKDKNRSQEITALVNALIEDVKNGLGFKHLTAIIEPSFAELANAAGLKRTGFRTKAGVERFVYYVRRL